MNIDNLKFNDKGLIPCIAQDARTRKVLMPGLYEQGISRADRRDGLYALLQPLARAALEKG